MDYKKFGFIVIAFNFIMLLILIFAGLQHESHAADESTQTAESASETVSSGSLPRLSQLAAASELSEDEQDVRRDADTGLLLLLSSVNSDLKIKIINADGTPAAGTQWDAVIKGASSSREEQDTDRDGVIYLDSVPGGRYMVNVKGAGEAGITVKDRIRYTAVTNIRSILVPESQINAAAEDTGTNDETDNGSLSSDSFDLAGGSIGIDVSKYNKDIDWSSVAASGVRYAIIRAGYRGSSTGCLVEDPYFERNFAGAREAGLKVGVYFFTQALNTDEAAEEAEAVAAMVNASDLDLPVYLDVEGSGRAGGRADSLDKATRTANIKAFCDTMSGLGFNAGVYANKKWLTSYIDAAQLSDQHVWLAQYNVQQPTYDGQYSIWQYTSRGSVDGISGNVDMDLIVK